MRSKPWFSRAWLGLTHRPARQPTPALSTGFNGQVEELEARILFSAEAASALIDPVLAPVANDTGSIQQVLAPTTADQQQAAPTTQTSASASAISTELVFVDARVPDAQTLIAQIVAQQDGQHTLEIHWLDGTQDGVNQISSTLQGRQDISAIHLISHGSDGNVQMGSTWLNEGTLPAYLGQLTSWQSALTQNADILIYGCDVAQTAQGQRFVDNLALLTGADVAASNDKTGAASLGADWQLEYQAGIINAPTLLGSLAAPQWNHVLDTVTLRDGLNGYTSTTDTYLAMLSPGTDYSTSTTLSAGRSTTQDPFQTLLKFENLAGSGTNQIPQGSVVTSVTLTLYMTASPTFTNPTFSMYKMLSAWTDTSTYISMGSGVDGSEYRSTADMTFTDSGTGSYSFTYSTAGHAMIATVQSWIDTPSSNQGWYLFCDDNSSKASFASSENGTAANRPTLAITYTPPTPPSMDLDANNSSGATGNNYSGAFVENSPAVKVADSDATITAGSSSLTGMTVTLGAVPDGAAESLAATTSGTNITASYSAGVLTLSGTDTAANYQSVLRSITYNNTSDTPNTAARTLTVVLTDANGKTATATSTLSVTATNDAPVITSNGGGATASISVAETLTAVTTVTSTDPEGTARSYSIVAGGDGAKFSINSSTGVLTFVAAPDFEAPTDSNADNVYVVTVQASDGSLTDTQTISVTVTDVSSALVVTTTADTNDSGLGASFTAEQLNAVNAGSDGKISLREAIIAANNTAGTDTISFAITGATGSYGEYTITATSALPTITQAVNINAATQSGYVAGGVHTVVLDGNDAAAYGLDLTNTADGSTIRGLVIRNFTSYGIYVESGSDGNTIAGNFIGSFNADGSNKGVGFGNATAGLYVRGANTIIGGTTTADRNVISGNPGGYNIYMATGADGTVVKGNYIGLNAAGSSVFSTTNPNYGIMIETSATNVTIGGTVAGSGNVISGHTREGIWVTTTGAVTIQGNYIGTDVTGTIDLGNTRYGIYLDDTGTATIGGTTAGAGNLISGNDLGGIYASNNSVTLQGNIIGLNAAGTAKLANTGSGIEVRTSAASTIGGNGSGYRNIISGNTAYGIDVETSNAHVIKGNYIGVGADGVTLLGNTQAGIYISATGTIVGGKASGDGNIIAGNGGAGIAVAGGNGNLFYRNSIYSNTGIGIDLGNDGVTANDYNDADGGANYQTNYPVITSVVTNGTSTTITGSIDWYQGPDTLYIELYASTSKDATGYGQGKTYLGAAQVTTAAGTGDATFSLTVTGVSVGDWISAIANAETSFIGASEFAKAVQAVAPANAPRGRVIWNNNDRFYQSYADWSTTGFSGVGTDGLSFSDDISMITAAEAPTRNEILFIGSADASGKILAGIWNGSTWSSVISIPVASPSASAQNYDSFAIAYDPVSGDAMMVWDNGNTGTTGLSYATWNGTSWSAINTITAPVSGEPLHMKLAAKPNSHEMTLAVETNAASNNQYAIVWNGSSWGNAQTLGTNTNEQYFELNVAYEQQSGKAMVVYGNSASNSANVQYRTWNGSAWSSEGTITAPVGITSTADLYSTAIASDPTSNRLAIAAKNSSDEIWLAVWNGSSWGSTQVATTTGHSMPEDHPSMSVAFESQSGDLLAAYGKSAGPNVYYRTWTSGGGWSAENTGPSIGGTDIPYIVKLYADPYSNTIMMGVQDNAYDLNFVAWDGSAWGTVTELDNNTVFYYRENFTYVWFQNAPVIANLSGDTLAFTEDQSAQVIDQGTSATVALGDQTLYNGGNLTVSFTAGSTSAEDVLAIRNQGTGAGQIGISGGNVTYAGSTIGTYTGGSAGANLVITFNSNATDAAVTALVKNITYQNTNTSLPSTSTRTVRFVATNALGQASANNDVSVTVTSANDAPTNTVPTAQSINEDTTLVFSSGNGNLVSIADVDAGSSNVQVTLTVTNGTLTLSGITGLSFTVGDGTADTTMTFTGTVNAINTALAGMGYSPTANYSGAASLTILTSDLGNTGSGGSLTDTEVVSITVNAVNDAPVGTSTTVTTLEDTAYTFTAADFGFTDPSDSPANTLLAVKITTLPANGSLTLNGVAVTSGQFISAANIASGLLKFTPAANANGTGYTSFTFQVQDNGGTANGGVDLDTSARTMTVNVTAVNDAPSGASRSVTTLENTSYVFSAADFGFTDANDSPANNLLAVKITTVPGAGNLTLNGIAVNAGDFVLASDIAAGKLVFDPALNATGTNYASLTFQVQDDGGTANGGIDLDATPRTLNINVTLDLNTAPQGADNTLTGLEDTPYVFNTADFGFSDPGDTPADNLLAIRISTLPAQGTLALNGIAVNAGDFILASDIAASRLTYTPAANAHGLSYTSFTFQVQDDGGTAGGGVDLDPVARTITMDITQVNDAPVGTNKTLTMLEESVHTFGAADFGFTDPNDGPANAWTAVMITTLPGAGTLSLNGVAVTSGQLISAADVNAGLLTFASAANGHGTGYTSFTFQVQDDGGTANGGVDLDPTARTLTVDVTSINDAPVGTSNTVSTNEDSAYTFSTADFGFIDPNDAPANALLAVKITTTPLAGGLTLNGVAINNGDLVQASDIAAGKLVFTPAADAHGAGYASFTFQVQDDGGTANAGVDLDATPRTMTVDVTAVNDAPVGTNHTVSTNEDTAYTFSAADFGFTDPHDAPANALLAVKITTVPANGSFTLNGVAVTAGDVVQAIDIAAGKLVFTPTTNAHGAAYTSFTFQVQDNGGTANGGVNLDATARTMTIDVTSVNDAPAGANNTVTTNEDTAYTFTATDFGFTDASDSPVNTLLAVKISTLPANGSLTLHGAAVTAGQFVSAADIASGLLTFTPAANANGTGYTSFTFQVQDNGGTAHGGVDLDPTARTMTVDVTAVNDAPLGTNHTVSTDEDTAYTFSAADFGFTDASDSPANTLLAVKITTVPANGSLTLNGVAITAGQFISAANITSGLLKFTPDANLSGPDYASFTFQVQDNGGTTNSGVDLDASARTMTIDVTAVNDAPVGTSNTVSTNEDTAYTFTTADFGFTDPSDSPANTLLAVKISTTPGAGTLTLNGAVVTNGQFVSAADIISGLLTFTPAANANGTGYASFTFQVQDNGGTAHGGVDLDPTARTMTVDVTSVNEAPAGTNQTVSTNEGSAYTFSSADFGFTDASDSPANTLLAVKISTLPANGSLTLHGAAVTAGQFVSAADIAAGLLTFTPEANANGTGYASFTFQVQDNGGTASGGVDLDPTARTMTFDVIAVNDAPVGTNHTVSTSEDSSYTFTTADFGFTDPNDTPANTLLNIKIGTLPTNGSLTLNGMAVTTGQFISATNIDAGLLSFTPAANANGTGYASFTFQVQDNGGTANSGVDLDPIARTLTVDVAPVADPSIALVPGAGYDVVEQTGMTLSGTGLSIASIDAGGATIQATLTVASGTLTASQGSTGAVVSGAGTNQLTLTGSQTQINALLDGQQGATLGYINNLNAPPASDTLTLSVHEGGITTASGQTSIRIAAVNDSPTMSAATLSGSTASSTINWTNSTLLNGAIDPDGDALSARVVQGPQHGTLSVDGNGQLIYTAASGYTGSDSFIYEAFDGQAASSTTRTMTIDIITPPMTMPGPITTTPDTQTPPPAKAPDTGNSATVDTPEKPDAVSTPEAAASPAAATTPQTVAEGAEGTAPAALHERIRPSLWLGASPMDSGGAVRQIDLTRMVSEYFTASWGNAGNNATVIQLLELIKPTAERAQDINLLLTPLSSVTHALPAQAATEATGATQDEELGQAIRLTKVASYSTGLGLSIGTIWWTARISGLVTSALISTPAWRSLDPLPVVTSPSDDPDHDEDGDSRLGDREVEHLFDGDKPIEQDMPVIQ